LGELNAASIETEMMQLGGSKVFGCLHCEACVKNRDLRCVRKDDDMNEFIRKTHEADGIIIGSPTYVSNVSTEVKAYIDRCNYVNRANGGVILRGKVGAPVVSMARSGATFTYAAINFFFGIAEMIIPSSSYWNLAIGHHPGEAANDAMGMETFLTLGKNMAGLMRKLSATG
jgi:multimeric flavodoxin WrbA